MDEHDPVEESEFLYRRIHPDYFDPTLSMPVMREAFRPTKNDTTGLSLFRAGFIAPEDTLGGLDPDRAKKYYVARLEARQLRQLGLTIIPEPIAGGPPGHAVIPELSWDSYQARKKHWRAVLVELAKLASVGIVHRPPLSP